MAVVPKKKPTTAVAVVVISVALLLLVALMHSLQWRGKELFVDTVNINTVKSPKSTAYDAAGVRLFYSDGRRPQGSATAFFMFPAVNDIMCTMGSSEVMSLCAKAKMRINDVTCNDETTLVRSAYNCSRTINATSKVPVDKDDCIVRVLDGMYNFVKSCVTVSATVVPGRDAIFLPAAAYGTKLLMLTRPVFVSGPLCELDAVSYANTSHTNDGSEYDSSSGVDVLFPVDGVTDPIIWDGTGMKLSVIVSMIRDSSKKFGAAADEKASIQLPLTMYYLNYLKRINNNAGPLNVVTLYIRPDRMPNAPFQMNAPIFRVAMTHDPARYNGQRTIVINTAKGAHSMPAPPSSVVVVTYTTNLLVMCMMSMDRVCIRRIEGLPTMSASDGDWQKAASMFPPPPQVYPYDNRCIPNFADIAVKFGFLS